MYRLKIFTYCIPSKINSKGLAPVRLRIQIHNETINLATGVSIDPEYWDKKKGKIKLKHPRASNLNSQIKEFETKVYQCYDSCIFNNEDISASKIKNLLQGKTTSDITLSFLIDYHINNLESKVPVQYSISTLKQFQTLKNKLLKFLNDSYSLTDISLNQINYRFITQFEAFNLTVEKNSTNTTSKYMKRLRTLLNVALRQDWINATPFSKYKGKTEPSNRQYLSQKELLQIEEFKSNDLSLETVRDGFLFMAYTGLSYCDLKKLTSNNIITEERKFLRIERGKTKQQCEIPLFEKSEKLIEKYSNNLYCKNRNVLFPVLSNQKMNQKLKSIAKELKLTKPLTCHIARHTFATISLELGVPIETLSKVLAHSNIKTTQIYGKITQAKIEKDYSVMANTFGRFEKKVG